MWSTCSMSTGHCWTQAPQVVQDQSTSGSITPASPFSDLDRPDQRAGRLEAERFGQRLPRSASAACS